MNTSTVCRRMVLKSLLAGLTCLGFAGLSRAAAVTHYVSRDGTNHSPYLNWADAATNIQWAVTAAVNNDTVMISNDTYVLTGTVSVADGVTLKGFTGDPKDVIISGNGLYRVLYINHTNAVVDAVTITNGMVTANYGGGAYLNKCRLMTNCMIAGNSVVSYYGGGIYIAASAEGIRNCSVLNNVSTYDGGGVFVESQGTVISNCVFYGNRVTGGFCGGGLYVKTYADVIDCVFSNNTAALYGGGASGAATSTGKYFRCLFVKNRGANGGGLQLTGYGRAVNCDFVSNVCNQYGGAYTQTLPMRR